MIKICCDICGKELTKPEVHYCDEMIGRHYCTEHMPEERNTVYEIGTDDKIKNVRLNLYILDGKAYISPDAIDIDTGNKITVTRYLK